MAGIGIVSADHMDSEAAVQCTTMNHCIAAVEAILRYYFCNKSLLVDALTHGSCNDSRSYQRLEFVGDAALGLAVSNFLYLTYPDLDAGQLSILRAANISTEKLARVAVNHGLYKYVRHWDESLSKKVGEFVIVVEKEEEMVVHGGEMRAPKVLADIVEAVAAAVYVDCGLNLPKMWDVIGKLLEPIVMKNDLDKQPQPITMLFKACQKNGHHLNIRHERKGDRNIAAVYIDGKFVASGSSDNKDNAKLHAAEAALSKLTKPNSSDEMKLQVVDNVDATMEIENAKTKLHDICNKKRWSKPTYRVERQFGPAHERGYVSSVQIEFPDRIIEVEGDERCRLKDAENSAASVLIYALQDSGFL